jgi:flagellar biosynthesis/type III secretory pathway protein FliH
VLHFGLIERALSKAAAEICKMQPQAQKLMSESQRQSYDRGCLEGEARGEAKALLSILVRRGLAVTAEHQRRIAECTEIAVLDRWLERALSATTVDELLG